MCPPESNPSSTAVHDGISVGDTWYRYRDVHYAGPVNEYGDVDPGSGRLAVEVSEYTVTAITPKGVWLGWWKGQKDRFIRLTTRKRYAHATKEEALESFLARKRRQASIYKHRLESAEKAIRQGEAMRRETPSYGQSSQVHSVGGPL